MATASKAQHNSEKFNGSHSFYNSSGMEVSQDMHLKMSKKIAQLTKVIYALNTKNDEHEAVVENLKESQQREMGRLLVETKDKVSHLQCQIGNELEYKKKISRLEECIRVYEKQEQEISNDFSTLKREAIQRENDLRKEHSKQISNLTKELNILRKSYDESLAKFTASVEKLEKEHQKALNDLSNKQEREVEELTKAKEALKNNLTGASQELSAKYDKDIALLKKDLEKEQTSHKQDNQENEAKLKKAQAYYERELEAFKTTQSKEAAEKLNAVQSQYEGLRKEHYQAQAANKKKVDDLLSQVIENEETIKQLKNELKQHSNSGDEKGKQIDKLNKELTSRQKELDKMVGQIQDLKRELIASQENAREQAKESVKKSELVGALQATVMQHESTIKSLNDENSRIQDRLKVLEKLKKDLESSSKSQSTELDAKLKSYQEAIEELNSEKQAIKQRHEKEISNLNKDAAKRESQLKQSLESEHKKVVATLDKELKDNETKYKQKIEELTKNYENTIEVEKKKVKSSTKDLAEELNTVRKTLTEKLDAALSEILRLEKVLAEKESGLGSINSEIDALRESNNNLIEEAKKLREETKLAKAQAAAHKADLEKLKAIYETVQKDAKKDLNNKLSELSAELDRKWSETLRRECGRLRTELNEQASADKKSALEQLSQLKEKEKLQMREQLGMRREENETELKQVRTKIQLLEGELKREKEKASKHLQEEMGKLREILRESDMRAEQEKNRLIQQHEEQLAELKRHLHSELELCQNKYENKLKNEKEMSNGFHQSEIERIKLEAEETRVRNIDEILNRMQREKEELRADLMVQFGGEMEDHTTRFKTQMRGIEKERDDIKEAARKKELELTTKIDTLKSDLNSKDQQIKHLSNELEQMKSGLTQLSKELESRGKEIQQTKSDNNVLLKKKESELKQQYEEELRRLKSAADKDSHKLLENFNEAQALLKDKIKELNLRLEEAQQRYDKRDSREEDVKLINHLKTLLHDKESEVLKLVEEKKYYQMELVNRETNFNKVFNTTPQVGFINPLSTNSANQKKRTSSIDKGNNVKISQRLAPLPNSPLHDDMLNPTRPLPPPHKKTVT